MSTTVVAINIKAPNIIPNKETAGLGLVILKNPDKS